MVRASSSRYCSVSVAITSEAPAALAMPTAHRPIGPQPVTRTLRPSIGSTKAAWTALPIGSCSATTAGSSPFDSMAFASGMTTLLGEPAVDMDPDHARLRQRCMSPRLHWAHVQSNEVRSRLRPGPPRGHG